MNRLLALLTVALVAGVAVADVPPPPPPKGKKYVSVTSEVLLGKDVTGYMFVKQVTRVPGGQRSFSKVELGTEKPTAIPEPARRVFVTLFAVSQEAAKEFKTDDDLFAALRNNKVKGAHQINFSSTGTVSDTVKSDSVKWKYTITAIDEKGIKVKVEGEGYEPPEKPKKDGGNDSPEDAPDTPVRKCGNEGPEDTFDFFTPSGSSPSAYVPRGGLLLAGLSAFAALTLGGFWLVGRTRRKV